MAERPNKSETVKRAKYFLPYQLRWINDDSPLKLGDKSRRTGWTYCEAYDAVSRRFRKTNPRNCDYWFTSADESAAAEFIEYCRFWAKELFDAIADVVRDKEFDPDTREPYTTFRIICPNGYKIVALTSNPRRLRSKGGDVCMDEFDFHDQPEAMWDAATPLTQWGGSIRVFSTPNGEGTFYNHLVEDSKKLLAAFGITEYRERKNFPTYKELQAKAAEMNLTPVLSYHRITIEDAIEEGIVEKINEQKGTTQTRDEFRASCRAKSRSLEAFLQEYMCQPSADMSAWLPYPLIMSCESDRIPQPGDELTGYLGGPACVGIDVGRKKDRTVVSIGEEVGSVIEVRRMLSLPQNLPTPDQVDIIAAAIRQVKLLRVCVDFTGVGVGLTDYLARLFGVTTVIGIEFTNPTIQLLAVNLKNRMEDKHLLLPPRNQELRDALHKVKKSTTATGKVTFVAPRDDKGHSDEFYSLALLVEAFGKVSVPFTFQSTRQRTFAPKPVKGRWFG